MGSVTAQLFSGLSREVRPGSSLGLIKDIQRLVPKPLLCCLGYVLSREVWPGSKWWRPLCSWGPSMLHTFSGILPQICALTQSCLKALWTNPLTSWLGFCSDMHCQIHTLLLAHSSLADKCFRGSTIALSHTTPVHQYLVKYTVIVMLPSSGCHQICEPHTTVYRAHCFTGVLWFPAFVIQVKHHNHSICPSR